MKKRIISFVCVCLIAVSFSSCTHKMKYYTSNDGVKYELVLTDGNITVKDNKLLVYILSETGRRVKNENNEYRTDYIDFNGQVLENRYVETQNIRFRIPSGFQQSESTALLFYNDDYKSSLIVTSKTDFDLEKEKNAMDLNCNQLQESYGSDKFTYEISSVEMPQVGVSAYKYKMCCTSPDHPMTDINYYFVYNDTLYSVYTSIDNLNNKKVDFDKVIKSISFK